MIYYIQVFSAIKIHSTMQNTERDLWLKELATPLQPVMTYALVISGLGELSMGTCGVLEL